jgi:hypothetical protein
MNIALEKTSKHTLVTSDMRIRQERDQLQMAHCVCSIACECAEIKLTDKQPGSRMAPGK